MTKYKLEKAEISSLTNNEIRGGDDKTPYWRTLKADGELNAKYPGGAEAQKAMLEAEGHTIIEKGRKNIKYFVKDYKKVLFDL